MHLLRHIQKSRTCRQDPRQKKRNARFRPRTFQCTALHRKDAADLFSFFAARTKQIPFSDRNALPSVNPCVATGHQDIAASDDDKEKEVLPCASSCASSCAAVSEPAVTVVVDVAATATVIVCACADICRTPGTSPATISDALNSRIRILHIFTGLFFSSFLISFSPLYGCLMRDRYPEKIRRLFLRRGWRAEKCVAKSRFLAESGFFRLFNSTNRRENLHPALLYSADRQCIMKLQSKNSTL